MSLRFSKMHGIGNDFVLLDCRSAPFALAPSQIRMLGDRHRGVGFDQLISIEPSPDPHCAFYYGIWNTDGSPAGQCGNGVRCVAAWLFRAGALALEQTVWLLSPSGPVCVRLLAADRVAVNMGEPDFAPAASGFGAATAADRYALRVSAQMPGQAATDITVHAAVISMGNPHAVVEVESLDDPSLAWLGPALTAAPEFADGVNVGFVRRIDRGHLSLRVHERGAGWTQACGSGACAAAAALQRRGDADARVQVDLPGGRLQIDWAGPGQPLWMTGPASFVFDGDYWLDVGKD